MKRWGQVVIFVICVVFSVAGLYNVMSDNIEVIRMATVLACGTEGKTCADKAQMTRMERNPIAQSFEITTPKKKVDVRCARQFILAGDYSCELR